jgi:hypothetical protein
MKRILTALTILCAIPYAAMSQSEYVRDAMEKKFGAAGLAKLNEWMNDDVLKVKMEDTYVFPYEVTMHLTTYKKGAKKDETDIRYFLNPDPDKQYFATEASDQKKKQEILIIYDTRTNAMLMLRQNEKTGLAVNINAFTSGDAAETIANQENTSVSCNKTGRSKSIRNYPCEEYVCTDLEKNTRIEVWITDRVPVNIVAHKTPGSLFHLFGNVKNLEGLLIAGDFYRDDVLETSIEVTEINDKANLTINTAEYTFSNQ